MRTHRRTRHFAAASLMACLACSGLGDPDIGHTKKPFSSAEATLVDFEFAGELVTLNPWFLEQVIRDQLLYTIGHLNGDDSVGRLDKLSLTDITVTATAAGGGRLVSYRAMLPVAWGDKDNYPPSYEFILPKQIDANGLTVFTDRYMSSCVDRSAHDVTTGSMWYYYRPRAPSCVLDEADVVRATASVSLSTQNTSGKYPEYDQIWADGALRMVAIFGKNEDGATENTDPGISAYNSFVRRVRRELGTTATITPANLPAFPSVDNPDVTIGASLAPGRSVTVNVLLVDNVRTAGPAFDLRYEGLSTEADLIAYNGHAGLGSNVRALARKGQFRAGKYQIFFMNGCDTFAYVDGALAQTRARLNPDDPTGTRYMEIVTNAMPAYFHELSRSDTALLTGLLSVDAPLTYDQIFGGIDPNQVVVVTGEEDNVFEPNPGGNGWPGLQEEGTLARGEIQGYETETLQAGRYRFAVSGTGDVDLYVRIGEVPSFTEYDCRPYLNGSVEACVIDLAQPAVIHVMIHGYGTLSSYTLSGRRG